MLIKYQYWIRDKFYCDGKEIGTYYGNGKPSRVCHTAYFCATCGEVWARKVITQAQAPFTVDTEWYLEYEPCHKHGGGSLASIWVHDLDTLVEDYPLGILINEFLILHKEKFGW